MARDCSFSARRGEGGEGDWAWKKAGERPGAETDPTSKTVSPIVKSVRLISGYPSPIKPFSFEIFIS
jgi:hypothetical protein